MKKGLLCFLAIIFTALSYGQLEEVKKELSTKDKIETLSNEFKLSKEQVNFLEDYFNLNLSLQEKKTTPDLIASEKRSMESKLVKLFPLETLSEIRLLNKVDPKKLTKKDIGM